MHSRVDVTVKSTVNATVDVAAIVLATTTHTGPVTGRIDAKGLRSTHLHRAILMKPRYRSIKRINLRKTLFVLPSLITLSSVFCGFESIRIASGSTNQGDFFRAAVLIVFAMLFDMFDGRVARMTKTQSEFGLQLDSLADVISFGVAPAVLVYNWSLKQVPTIGLVVSFVFIAAGAIRLARFNVMSMQATGSSKGSSKYFLGLPIPGGAGLLVSLVIANQSLESLNSPSFVWPMILVTLLVAFLMISNVRFRTFKHARFDAYTVTLLVATVASTVAVSWYFGPAFLLLWVGCVYMGSGLIETLVKWTQRLRTHSRSLPPS